MREGVIGVDRMVRWHSAKVPELKEQDLREIKDVEFDARKGQSIRAYKCTQCGYVELFVPT